jgi:hypothetical protein
MTAKGRLRWKFLVCLTLVLLVLAGAFLLRPRDSLRPTSVGAGASYKRAPGNDAMNALSLRPLPSGERVANSTSVAQRVNGEETTVADSGLVNGNGEGAVDGMVTDRAGNPIPGAKVRDVVPSMRGEVARREVRTDSEGKYRLIGLPPGWIVLKASRDGDDVSARTDAEIHLGATTRADFVLDETAVLTGHVRSKSGAIPRTPIKVTVLSANSIANGMGGLVSGDAASTAAGFDGFYKFVLPAPRDYNVYAQVEGRRGSFLYETGFIVSLDPGVARNVDLVISDDESLRIRVLEPGGSPSYYPLVSVVLGGSGHRRATLRAGEDGQTELSLPDDGGSAPILVEARNGGRLGSATLPPGVSDATIQLEESASVFGRVTANGSPVSGFSARVELVADAFGIPFGPFEFQPELQFAEDRYEFLDVPARHIAVIVNAENALIGSREVWLSPGGSVQVDVDLGKSGSIMGRVVDARHAPLQGSIWLDEISNWSDAAPNGRFRLDNVAVGVHQIKVSAAGYETKIESISIAASQLVEVGEVVLPPARVNSGTIGAMFVSNAGRVSINLILPESPASNAGLRVSDVVLSIDDQPVTSAIQAERRSSGEPGTIVAVTVARDGAPRSFAIVRAN